jgi:hypothetical protein
MYAAWALHVQGRVQFKLSTDSDDSSCSLAAMSI